MTNFWRASNPESIKPALSFWHRRISIAISRNILGENFMKYRAIPLVLALALSACSNIGYSKTDTLSLYRDMTRGKSQLEVRSGEPTQFSGSEKICITANCANGDPDKCTPGDHYRGSPLMSGSVFVEYYGLRKMSDGIPYGSDAQYEQDLKDKNHGYAIYGENSRYARDVAALVGDMDRLMESFKRTGLRGELERRGMTPALMFDLDNTLEFSAAPDSDAVGEGPAIGGMVDFANRWCFKDGVTCYFITARNCDQSSTIPTKKWLETNLKLDEETVQRHTFFSRNQQNLICGIPGNPTVAYKDVIREALERDEKVFWLMSVGDQLTDSLGEHSGMKVRVPNQFFHSDIAANQYAPWGVGKCGSPATIAPPRDCAESLVGGALHYTSLSYCSTLPPPK